MISVERFLAITAMLAAAGAMGLGCSAEDSDTNNPVSGGGGSGNKGGTGGADGSATGGTAGTSTGGTAGTATGGTAGSAGAAGSGGAACLGDVGDPDAGNEPCAVLPYYNTTCNDAGTDYPLGAELCDFMHANGRPGVHSDLIICLTAITGDACGAAHDAAVQACVNSTFPKACQHPPLPGNDGGTYDYCNDIANPASGVCDPGTTITEAECNAALNPFTTTYVESVLNCYDQSSGTDCAAEFETCVNLP